MPARFQHLPKLNLTLFAYWGVIHADDPPQILKASAAHPEYHPRARHLVDMSRVTGFAMEPAERLAVQARLLESFPTVPDHTIVVWYAPTDPGRQMAQFVARSWAEAPHVRVVVQDSADGVADVLGLPEPAILALLQDAPPLAVPPLRQG
jgi:hypothetical protein